jgi:hypothetical protein
MCGSWRPRRRVGSCWTKLTSCGAALQSCIRTADLIQVFNVVERSVGATDIASLCQIPLLRHLATKQAAQLIDAFDLRCFEEGEPIAL